MRRVLLSPPPPPVVEKFVNRYVSLPFSSFTKTVTVTCGETPSGPKTTRLYVLSTPTVVIRVSRSRGRSTPWCDDSGSVFDPLWVTPRPLCTVVASAAEDTWCVGRESRWERPDLVRSRREETLTPGRDSTRVFESKPLNLISKVKIQYLQETTYTVDSGPFGPRHTDYTGVCNFATVDTTVLLASS